MKDTNYDLTLLYTIDPELAVIAGGYMFANKVNDDIERKLESVFGDLDRITIRDIIKYCFRRIKDEQV